MKDEIGKKLDRLTINWGVNNIFMNVLCYNKKNVFMFECRVIFSHETFTLFPLWAMGIYSEAKALCRMRSFIIIFMLITT